MRRYTWYLGLTVVFVLGAFVATVAVGNTPSLGLDLQGGISVVLAPVGKVKSDSLKQAVDIIRNRVDSLGVAEPEISQQGNNVIIDLPGVKDRDKARRIVGRTAQLRFRPVFAALPKEGATSSSTTTTAPGGATTAPTTTAPAATGEAAKAAITSCDPGALQQAFPDLGKVPTTKLEDDTSKSCVLLPAKKGERGSPRYFLGRACAKPDCSSGTFTGKDTSSAKSTFSQGEGYVVDLKLKSSGHDKINELAGASFGQPPPRNAMAIVLDGIVQSAPAFRTSNFPGDVQISGNFSRTEASDLARLLNYGALPVQLKQLTSQNVSPTLGKDQLRSGIAAGVVGLALVALYMLFYYRVLGLVVLAGLGLSAAATYALVSYLSSSINLALTLAGVTGLIVSVGITVDSYVVYFERLKDEVRSGKTVRSSVERGFTRAFRTIVAADLVSLIGALALYLLAVGSVRGFAFFLGLSTLLDLAVAYFFMHPVVVLLSRRTGLVRMRGVGMAAGLDAQEAIA